MLLMSLATPPEERKPPVPGLYSDASTLDGRRVLSRVRPDPRSIASVCRSAHEGKQGDKADYSESSQAFQDDQTRGYGLLVSARNSMDHSGVCRANGSPVFTDGGTLVQNISDHHLAPHEQDEAIPVIDGELTMILGAAEIRAKSGALAYIPARSVHSFRINSDTARLLNFFLPRKLNRSSQSSAYRRSRA